MTDKLTDAVTEAATGTSTESRGRFSHFLLTRFNVRSFYHAAEPTDEWLNERLRLFRDYCLPSVTAQTNRNFRWLVFFDSLSPDWFREEIERDSRGAFEPVYVEGAFDATTVSGAVSRRSESPYVITTRLDNDDAVAVDFIDSIQSCFAEQDFEFINLVNGSQYAEGKVYLRPYTSNPFASLIEAAGLELPQTVFVEHHYRIAERGPVRNVRTHHPMWLQVIHGGNVLNEIVGLRVPAKQVTDHFSCAVPANDTWLSLAVDRARGSIRIMWRLARKPKRILDLWRTLTAQKTTVS